MSPNSAHTEKWHKITVQNYTRITEPVPAKLNKPLLLIPPLRFVRMVMSFLCPRPIQLLNSKASRSQIILFTGRKNFIVLYFNGDGLVISQVMMMFRPLNWVGRINDAFTELSPVGARLCVMWCFIKPIACRLAQNFRLLNFLECA